MADSKHVVQYFTLFLSSDLQIRLNYFYEKNNYNVNQSMFVRNQWSRYAKNKIVVTKHHCVFHELIILYYSNLIIINYSNLLIIFSSTNVA